MTMIMMTKTETKNGLTFEMAQTMVEGSKFKVLNKYKQWATPGFDFDDMIAESDIGVLRAWNTWDPEKALFNTHATNMINWHMMRVLDQNHPVFKMTVKSKNDLRNHNGETFETIQKKGKTVDAKFNEEFGLDGKVEFTREMWNTYVYRYTTKTFGSGIQNVKNACEYVSGDGDEGFNVLEQSVVDTTEISEVQKLEWLNDSKNFGKVKQQIVTMLVDGHGLDAIAKSIGMSKFAMAEKFGGLDLRAEKV